MAILGLAVKSFRNRKFTTGLTVLSIALSVMLLLGIEKIRHGAETSFTSAVSGTDLIIGARGSPVQLLLYSVFHVGNPTNNISRESYEAIIDHPQVKWVIPLSFGDSHEGYRVVGTTTQFYEHFRFAKDQHLQLEKGEWISDTYDATVGAEVATALGYSPEDKVIIAHGGGDESFIVHTDKPFKVTGTLKRTGTPVDRAVYVGLKSIDDIHQGLESDAHDHDPLDVHDDHGNKATQGGLSAILVGLQSRSAAISMQRSLNEYDHEPLTAVMPGVVLLELWQMMSMAERILKIVALLVVAVGLFSMLIILMTSLNERRREMAILRSLGARPAHVFVLIMGEAVFLTLMAIGLGVALVYGLMIVLQPWLESMYGLYLVIDWPNRTELMLLAVIALCGFVVGLIPGIRIYRYSLADGMTIRI
ncbi:MAG: ABC transporter permease [Gammaproteobacteria bacterium]|nr:ABC transporter permease [Gammaproteobacteria bacterium]